ncbi:hypothetical protein [Candidatus Palauibacter polyketidifaciens]|uniref:hypothetical protein n=1 Tax=Candidatus Palauibacter polyketidifaciens TaxID=3056740 RepID=UPI0028730354|nr:hypothetical protein [Candidatus Palauibacter polyketidifaciens]
MIAFLSERDDLWLSALVLNELDFGLRVLPRGSRRDELRGVLSELIRRYGDRVLPVDEKACPWLRET